MLHNKQRRTTQFTVPGGGTIMSQEFGTIKLKLWNITKHKYDTRPIHWPVIVIYKDQFTRSNVTDVMLLHLQLGHANIHKLRAAQEHYGEI